MSRPPVIYICLLAALLNSCGVIEKTASHGFSSGHYRLHETGKAAVAVYADVQEDGLTAYPVSSGSVRGEPVLRFSLLPSDSACRHPFFFSKTSLDIDLTSVLLKYRPATGGLPAQAVTDFNAALYAGPRFDRFFIRSETDPLGKCRYRLVSRGFDFGLLAGLGTTPISPFTTRNQVAAEYNALLLQVGIAGFAETSFASFGIAAGIDHLTNRDRKYWIYQGKPWIGLVVGIALN